MKNYKVYVKGMYTGEIELLASEVVAVEKDFEIRSHRENETSLLEKP